MAVHTSTMLRLVLILVLQCLLTNGQGPGPGPGSTSRLALRDTMQSRAVDTRLNFTVLEGQPTGTYIGSIPIKPGFTYRFNEVPKEFVLNGSTGELHTAKILDREALSTDKFDLVILSSQPTYPIEVRIVVLDLNDNAPRFPEPSIRVTFSENANAGTRVILDTATDGDAGENDITTNYRIVDGNEEGKFKLEVITNPSGETPYLHLETIEKLDMETRDSYQLNISAQDGGTPPHFGFLLVNVSILDVNDNSPTFDYGEYNVTLSESVPPGTSVLQVRASDADSNENARITYYLAETETQFSIDPETGVISTVERLKCHRNCPDESQCAKSCVFTVNARDHGSPYQDGRTYVTVNLQDANDHNPVVSFTYFPANAEFATVDENAKNASTVAVVSVIDADEGFNGETTVEIAGGNEMNHFRLESKPNYDLVQVNGVLDREKISKYNVTIVATDMGSPPRSSTSFLIIYVNDINDHAPVFEKSEYSAVLSELVPVGTYVAGITANDEDTGVNSNVYYAITSGNNNRWFDIDVESGLITTKALLNREEQDSVDLKISARDGGPNPKRAYTHLKITILDANDEKPTFAESLIQVSLSESAAPHTLVAQVSAIDRDQGTNGSVSYIFSEDVELKYPGVFYLDSSSGRVTTRSKLDREAMPQYDITVEARDRGIPPLSSTATVRLSVLDVNDNSPEFYPQQYFVAVAEDNPIGSSLVQVSATDKDDGENAEIIYELTSGPDNDNTFAIHPQTGVLTLSGRLSRIRKSKYRLTVAAKDKGDRKAAKDAVIEILIEGNQSEFLEFESDLYAFEVPEDTGQSDTFVSKEVGSVSVKDTGFGDVMHTIVAGDPDKVFTIDEKSGVIKTAKHLDGEERSFYSLKVVATSTDVYGHTIVNVTVNDINDNPPKFPTRQAHASVNENWPVGHQVFLAEAYDPDLGKNSDVTYTLTANPRNYFSISKKSGMIYLNKPVKFGHTGTLRLEVTATDDGVPPLSSRQIVMVTVEDVNDHTPIFEHGSYETSLFESIPVNDRFFALTASDEDSGMNGFVSYNITSGNDDQKFGIFPDGYLYIRSSLDRENKDYYALTIVARDHGEPSRSATVLVVIHILDENDNAPVFTNKTFDFYLAENAPPDTYVGRLTATDQDKGRNAELTFAIATNQQQFLVDPKSGFLKTLNYFDREKLVQVTGQDYITMEAIVVDNGISKLRDKAKVNIFITDVNDNSPKFSRKSYKAEVFEGASVGTPIVRLAANDADQGLNGDIIYTLVDGNEEGRFQIDGVTGQVALSRQLDRETTPLYLLTVAASDLGSPQSLTATTTLSVHVLDENDNKPVFTHKESQISVSETTEVNTVLVQFKASDADIGVNQEVSFMIGGGNIQEVFRIDTRTGTLYLEKPIDYEQRSTYRLNITAADGGSPRLTSTVEFVVRVLDYNDNAPTFPNTTIVRQIQEGIPYKTTIVTVTAHDPDSGLNGKITYAIKNQDPPGRHFEIEKDTGVIFTIRDIDREFNDTFMLTVVASDQAEPVSSRLSAEKLVTVVVEDINDNAPVFVSMNAGLLPENSRKDQKIMQILANDIDANTNGLVTYEIVGGSAMDVFYLDRVTGSLRLRKDIPSPELFYRVTVRSTDEAVQSQRKSSDAYLTILGMSSQEGPRFTQSFYTGSVVENSAIGTSVATIESHLESSSPDDINYFVVNITSDDGRLMERLFDVQQKGVLATAAALDREAGPDVYLVTVAAAVTKSSTPRVSLTQVRVTILDQNDSPPSFRDMPHRYTVSEDHQAGRRIATLSAVDSDTIGTLTYSLVSGDDEKFTLDESSGHLSLRETLDRETKDLYELVVRASDGVQHTDTTVKIQVTDTNDNPPQFQEPAYSFDIPENAKGSQVGQVSAWDADEDTNGHVSYTVISEWGNDVFSLNPQTGIFTLTSLLDYEQVQHYILVVQAQDTGRPSLSSTVTVYFNVQDLNDNAPSFHPMSYSDEVYENITIGSPVLTVYASDQDSGLNGELEFSIAGGDDKGQFSISSNGSIYTRAPLDREDQSFYNLVVRASDRAEPPEARLSSTVQVTIILRDVNDMAPEFVSPDELTVPENTPVNTVIMAVKALDRDEGRNSYIEYSLEPVPDNRFTLGPVDGLLQIAGPLDRETRANYSLVVTARDRGSVPNARTLTINLKIADENDNSPIFDPKQYSSSVPENASIGLSVLQVSATDSDEGLNGRVRYSIVAGDKNRDFSIGEDTGVIRVAKNLNYERRNHYLLTVQAEDSGGDVRYDSATVTISIMDINDNPPVFLDSPYLVYVMENMRGLPTSIATVTAFDADNPPYNRVNYLVKDGDKSLFAVNASSGEISLLRALDREEEQHYSLTIVAIDSGTPRLTGTGTISVLVRDENDHSPQFQKPQYTAIVSESVPPDTAIISLTATDKDYGLNAKIRYSLVGGAAGSDVFRVDPENGVVKTLAPLDREAVQEYTILVEAKDSSLTDPRSATTQLTVTLLDENDNAPKFAQEYYVIYIPDPTPTGSFVFGRAAVDNDDGVNGRITYYLSGPDADKFSMKQETGVIKAATTLTGREVYDLEIHASDSGSPPLSSEAKLKVYLRPASLFPEFKKQETSFSFSESERGNLITTLSATSPKLGPLGRVHYDIAGGNIGQAFEVHEQLGEIRISRSGLDYETLPQYELWVSARDSDDPPLASATHIVVNVSDYNDNPPVFDHSVYNASIIEDLFPAQLVARVRATDRDSNQNAQISYHLRKDSADADAFKLNSETGEIFTKVKLDRESVGMYSLVVEAVDKGTPPLTGTAMVQVTVQDKNDNPPRFTRLFSVNVTENAQVGTFVIQVTSSDRDIGENANATYSFTVNPDDKFHIDPVSGNVTVASAIDREARDEYLLKVSAFDGSWRAETPLTIIVQDENDNPPVFENDHYDFNFPELQRSVAFVGQVSATDKDKSGPNSAITYSLKFPNEFFSVDPTSGELLSKQSLKYRHTLRGPSPENQYQLVVIATDNGKPPMSSHASVFINVVDANNNVPTFTEDRYFSPVLERAEVGQKVIQVKAVDEQDFGINAEIEYEKVGGNGSDYFSLDTQSGFISVAKPLEGKTGTRFALLVRARDKGVPPRQDDVVVVFEVTDENQHTPQFTALSYQVMVAENEKIGSAIIKVAATDGDKGVNGRVKYKITSGNEAGKFEVNDDTGAISVKESLDYDTLQLYTLNISAQDLAFHPYSATALLTIKLADVNDNPPLFTKEEFDASIPENSPAGTLVFQLEATDIDSGQNAVIRYKIVGGDGRDVFSINAESGVIVSKKSFDYEEKNRYDLQVMAVNPDSIQTSSAKVIVHITSRNEFYPRFVQPVFQFTVSESASIGTSLGSIQATDEDKGADGMVYYLLVGSSNDRGFLIGSTSGELTVSRNLDRESQNRVVLTVMAKNAGSIRGNDTDEAQIIIAIQDGNDPPVFSQPYYETSLSEGALVGTIVVTVTAVDSDVRPQNNQFTYSIIGGNLGHVFKVDPQTGVIETTGQLDREAVPVYNLTIGAIDNGTPTQTGTTLVKVILEDVNDNGPQFDPPKIVGYVSENEPAMTSVMTLSASDPDLPPNTMPFSYQIAGGEHREFFTVDGKTGEVKTTRSIDRETTPVLNFRIQVEDNGKPKMKSEHEVTINVLDKNDSPSTSRLVKVAVLTFRGNFPGGNIADVHPNDPDSDGKYTCQILEKDSSIFSIPNACNLHVAKITPDRTYSLTVSGNDGRHNDVTSTVEIEFSQFDNVTLDNSITLRALNVTSERFLLLYYQPFKESLEEVFGSHSIEISSMLQRESHTDLTLSVLHSSKSGYLEPTKVTNKLSAENAKITKALQGLKVIINYNPCDESPCQNGGDCSHGIKAYDETETVDSPKLVFTSPLIKHDAACNCKQGFTGRYCELRQDPCAPNPCQAGGTCARKGFNFICTCPPSRQGQQCEFDKTNACDNNPCRNGGSCQTTLEGGFFCLCRPGYRGMQCELVTESCKPNPCMNGGSCISLKPDYRCSCESNFYGLHCEKSTFSFRELSYMTFPTLDATTNDISLTFSTNKPDSLLVYNFGVQTGGRSDFVAIELSNGRPRFSYGGARTAITSISVNKKVTDGGWYRVTATRNGRVVSLSVASCSKSGDVCKDCRPGDSSCSADDTGPTGTLNFNNEPMYMGGVMTVDPIQERPGQVLSDDFVGCLHGASINGRPLNLSGAIQTRGISDVCERRPNVCIGNPCGEGGVCVDHWSTHMCICPDGLMAKNCESSLYPASFDGDSYIEFLITEQHRRRQLLPWLYHRHTSRSSSLSGSRNRISRQLAAVPPKNLSFRFRTLVDNGILVYAATNNDYTMVVIRDRHLEYTSKLGANQPVNMTIMEPHVSDGEWHNLTLLSSNGALQLVLDSSEVGEKLDLPLVHDFLDAYLTSITIGAAPHFVDEEIRPPGFIGCIAALAVDGEVQPFNSTGTLLQGRPKGAAIVPECVGALLGPATATDPLSIGITLVIIFFVLLLVAIMVSFIVYRVRKQRKEKNSGHVKQNGSALLANTSTDSGRSPQDSGYAESAEMTDDVLRSHLSQELTTKKYKDRDHERPQRPDIIEREIMNKSPGVPLRVEEATMPDRDNMAGHGNMPDEVPEHYDLENASSIAPSDIDIVYHYKGYRDGNIRKYKTNPHVPGYHKHSHRHSPHNFPNTPHRESPRNILRQSPNPVPPRESPSVLKMQSTPLARLSPSSELSQQTPRILTLQDLSGKPLQTALLGTSQGPGVKDVLSNSERSLNSPVSHLSQSSGSMHASSQATKKKKHDGNVNIGLTPEEIDRLNHRPRNSSLVSTLDAVSSSSEDNRRKDKIAELLETNTALLEAPDSSTDESGNDSFTCSEFEYENNYEKVTRDFGPGNMIFSKLAEVDNENEHDNESSKNYDGFDSFRGSLSTLVASDDDLSNMSSYKPPNGSSFGWDYLLNWGPNFESLVGVFKDIAELPDNTANGRVSARGTPKPTEEYV